MNRNVVVSGGGTGIGKATAQWFARAGDTVWIVGRREPVLASVARSSATSMLTIAADVSTVEGAEAVRGALDGTTVDVIVAAAGGTTATRSANLADFAAEWTSDLQQNLMSAVLLVEALRPALARPGGRVIGLGSIGAQLGSGYGGSYGAAKAALHAWTYWLASDLGTDGITANLVLPGYIPDTEFFGDRRTEDFDSIRVNRTVLGRAGSSDEVAATIGFLASAEAGYITGQLIGVSGGTVFGR